MSAPIVVSLGSHTTRVGYADEGRPTLVVRSQATVLSASNPTTCSSSTTTHFLTSSMKGPQFPVIPEGGGQSSPTQETEQEVQLWTEASITEYPAAHQDFVNALLGKLLGAHIGRTCQAPPPGIPKQSVMIVVPAHLYTASKSLILGAVGTFFFNSGVVSQIHVAHSASCATLGSGLPSAILMDIGHTKTSVVAVHNGLVLHDTAQTESVGGQSLEVALADTPLGQELVRLVMEGEDELDAMPGAAGSGFAGGLEDQLQKLKEVLLCAPSVSSSASSPGKTGPPVAGGAAFATQGNQQPSKCPTPAQLYQGGLLVRGADGHHKNLALMVVNCRRSVDAELKGSLPVVLVGGTAQGHGLAEALQTELRRSDAVFHKQAPIIGGPGSGASAAQPQHQPAQAAWLGGALMSGSSAFNDMWVAQDDWNTQGAEAILSTRMA